MSLLGFCIISQRIISIIAQSLARIFENSWHSGEVPEDWTKANVMHIFKKGKKVDPVTYHLDKGEEIDVVYLDFKKAFDLVSLDHPLAKLANCSLRSTTIQWLGNWSIVGPRGWWLMEINRHDVL